MDEGEREVAYLGANLLKLPQVIITKMTFVLHNGVFPLVAMK
jgi:hypothetical protein